MRADLSLADAAQETRISAKYLEALEEDAGPEAFPAPAYARFFLREYADYLGLDPAPLLGARLARFARAEEPGSDLDLDRIPTPVRESPRRILTVLVVAASLVTLAVLVALSLRAGDGEAAAPPPPRPSPAGAQAAAPAQAASPQPPDDGGAAEAPAFRGIHAVLTVSAPTWVEITADGEVTHRETLPEGQRVVIRAREVLQLLLGNAGGVSLRVNDREVPTGGPGEVVTLSFGWEDGRLIRH